ncbi:hypothetical protein [Escherichia coli]|uniref:hypothetical protein n=1 Tax=Escherichia coli TaxID=562 RepID=UPI00191A2714|nr:hypothetical protein [Escherichia coli]CAD5620161.1 Uncharacterised protein [Escherichia coli]
MESNIKGLVAAGHEMASELKAECGAVDMRSVAKLISDLATQLEVQLVRANALAAENSALKDINAWCKTDAFSNMYREFKTAEAVGCCNIDCMHDAMVVAIMHAPEAPTTNAFLAEVRAQGVELAISQAFRDVIPVNRMQFISRMTAFAAQLRKGGNQ